MLSEALFPHYAPALTGHEAVGIRVEDMDAGNARFGMDKLHVETSYTSRRELYHAFMSHAGSRR